MIEPAAPRTYLITFEEERLSSPHPPGLMIRGRCFFISSVQLEPGVHYTAKDFMIDDYRLQSYSLDAQEVLSAERETMVRDLMRHAPAAWQEHCAVIPADRLLKLKMDFQKRQEALNHVLEEVDRLDCAGLYQQGQQMECEQYYAGQIGKHGIGWNPVDEYCPRCALLHWARKGVVDE